MKEIIIGIVSGIVSGTGMGGGTILIFLLTFMCGIEQHIAQATNLIFFIPTSIVAIIVNIKNKNIKFKIATIISIFGILGAIVGANISIHTDVNRLRKFFGIFLAVIAIHEIYTIIKENKKIRKGHNKNKIDRQNI
ncbi:MAG: sulfite exporter TauE/SafE family protein [Clostridia bacterium]|nr:putative permease [Clostridium sp. CAG:389]